MKYSTKIISGTVILIGLQLGSMTGCVGYVGGGDGGYYDRGGPWFDGGGTIVVGGGGWYGGHGDRGYVHPGGGSRGGGHGGGHDGGRH
jgi:hypothetical protein